MVRGCIGIGGRADVRASAGGGRLADEFGDAWRVGDGAGRPVVPGDCVGDFVAQGWSLPVVGVCGVGWFRSWCEACPPRC